MAQSTRTMKHIIPCQDGQKELSDIMLTMEKYSVETQTREQKWKVIFHKLSFDTLTHFLQVLIK